MRKPAFIIDLIKPRTGYLWTRLHMSFVIYSMRDESDDISKAVVILVFSNHLNITMLVSILNPQFRLLHL